jgi:hypothetical protein
MGRPFAHLRIEFFTIFNCWSNLFLTLAYPLKPIYYWVNWPTIHPTGRWYNYSKVNLFQWRKQVGLLLRPLDGIAVNRVQTPARLKIIQLLRGDRYTSNFLFWSHRLDFTICIHNCLYLLKYIWIITCHLCGDKTARHFESMLSNSSESIHLYR